MLMMKSRMNEDLRDIFAESKLEMCKLYTLIMDGKADPKKDYETMTHWACLVELEDEKLQQERDKHQWETRAAWNELKHGHTNAFQSNSAVSVAAPVQSFPSFPPVPPMPHSFPAFANTLAFTNAYYGPNVAAMSQSQNQTQTSFQSFGGGQVQLAPRYNNLEKWTMFFLAHFCIQCQLPFQNHHKSDNVCEPCRALGYQVHDINFINCWVQAHPNGFENQHVPDPSIIPRKPYMITAECVTDAVARQQAKGSIAPQYFLNIAQTVNSSSTSRFSAASSSNAIPLGSSSHAQSVAPVQAIPQNYVAPILHKHSFPPSDFPTCSSSHNDYPDSRDGSRSRPSSCQSARTALMPPFSNCAIVGVDNEEDRYIDADSGGYDEPLSPPPHNVHVQHSCPSFNAIRTGLEVDTSLEEPAWARRAETELLPPSMFPGDTTDDSPCQEITWNKCAAHSTGHKARSLE